jgi:hypothetical protein
MAAGVTARRSLRDDLRALGRCPRELWLVFAASTLEYVGVFSFLVTLALWLTSDFHMSDQRAGWWAAAETPWPAALKPARRRFVEQITMDVDRLWS